MSDPSTPVYVFGDFRADARRRVLARLDGEPLALTPKLFDTLLFLLQHAGEVLEKDRLMEALWPGLVVEENNLSQAISGLRKLLGDDGAEHRYIVTVPRRGYRFVADVNADHSPAAAEPPAAPPPPLSSARPAAAAAGLPAGRAHWGRPAALAGLVALLTAVAVAAWYLRARPLEPAGATVRTIAVLPFTNLGGAREDEFFGEGITEDMVTQLAQISDLRVTSRTSAARYKDSRQSAPEIARELGVDYILVGSVRRGDKRFRINAQLIDARRDENLWARTYDRGDQDILAVQSEVATEIATALKGRLLDSEVEQLARRAKGNPEAFVLYLRGRYILRYRVVNERDAFEGAAPLFRQVIALEPNSPLGYVGLANYHMQQARMSNADPHQSYAQADAYLAKALALDGKSVDALIQLAQLRGPAQWNWPEAEKATKRAIELEPQNANAWDAYRHTFLEPTGRLDEALAAQQRAVSLDPFNPYIAWRLAALHMRKGDCGEAMRLIHINIGRDPSYTVSHTLMVSCLESQGKFQEAIAENRLVKGYWLTDAFLDEQEQALRQQGEPGYRLSKLRHQVALAHTRNDSWYYAAMAAVQAGQHDDAFRYLNLAIDWVDRNVIYLKVDPEFAPVRGDPRYQAALKRLNLQ
jgi:TolB-like protein/DNA-binding winged helix-turn-helix (wHTH) protein/cytochrome c-type biogenesis protein CcmH/NrfG